MDSNVRTVRPASPYNAEHWEAYEDLPAPIRSALAESTLDWGAVEILGWYCEVGSYEGASRAEASILRMLCRNEETEIAEFARLHLHAHGYALPHHAAGASILRYDRCPS